MTYIGLLTLSRVYYMIIGRPVTKSSGPLKAVRNVFSRITE
jgi:3-keto-L-gulonate-6-phosphate decarboxylase